MATLTDRASSGFRRTLYWAVAAIGVATAITCGWAALLEHTLVADRRVLEFGERRQGSDVEARFQLTNRSFRPIEIVQVTPNCECADVHVSADTLTPFSAAEVRATWKLGSRRGRSSTELLVNFKPVGENVRRALRVVLHADVTPDVAVTPGQLVFDRDLAGERTFVRSATPLGRGSGERNHRLSRLPSAARQP